MAVDGAVEVTREDVAFEFFSGIGGFHHALRAARPHARVARAFDVDDVATRVYAHNFGAGAPVSAVDVSHLDAATLNKLGAGLWMMSPPCQPYTRQGNELGAEDARAGGLAHLTRLLASDELDPPERLLMENVVGFEASRSRDELAGALRVRGFAIREFWLSPVHVGIPNQRTRYFLLAKRIRPCLSSAAPTAAAPATEAATPAAGTGSSRARPDWPPHALLDAHELPPWDSGPGRPLPEPPRGSVCVGRTLREFLEEQPPSAARAESAGGEGDVLDAVPGVPGAPAEVTPGPGAGALPTALITKYGAVLNVVCSASTHSCCFTKNYARFAKGTGSVLATAIATEEALAGARDDSARATGWGLRYFTPREIANLHGFPRGDEFGFPPGVSLRKQYNLLGNSLSVDVVAELLRYLYDEGSDDS